MTSERKARRPCPTLSQSEPKNLHRISEDLKDLFKNEFDNYPVASGNGKRSGTRLSASPACTPSKRSKQKSRTIGSFLPEGTSAQRPYRIYDSDSEGESPTRTLFSTGANQANSAQHPDMGNPIHSEGDSPRLTQSLSPAIATAISPQARSHAAERVAKEDARHSVDFRTDLDAPCDHRSSGLEHEEESFATKACPLKFKKQNENSKSMIEVARKVWDTMAKKAFNPKNVKDNDYGYIYILTNADYPDYVKIGRTTNGPDQRMQQWSKCKTELVLVDQDDQSFIEVPFHTKLELLIQHDLWNEHHYFECVHCTPKDKENRRSDGGLKRHCEWFKMSKSEALLRIEAWRKWARCFPYDEYGLLKKDWKIKINCWRRSGNSAQILQKEDSEGRRFESFLKQSSWPSFSWLSTVEEWFCEPRFEPDGKPCLSRYMSLRTHWKSLFVFCVLHYGGSWIVAWCGARYIGALLTVASTLFAV